MTATTSFLFWSCWHNHSVWLQAKATTIWTLISAGCYKILKHGIWCSVARLKRRKNEGEGRRGCFHFIPRSLHPSPPLREEWTVWPSLTINEGASERVWLTKWCHNRHTASPGGAEASLHKLIVRTQKWSASITKLYPDSSLSAGKSKRRVTHGNQKAECEWGGRLPRTRQRQVCFLFLGVQPGAFLPAVLGFCLPAYQIGLWVSIFDKEETQVRERGVGNVGEGLSALILQEGKAGRPRGSRLPPCLHSFPFYPLLPHS